MKIFYSYSHKDERFRGQIEKHLTLLRDEGYIDEWYDRMILPGQEIHKEIDHHLETSDLVLFLLSPDFIASSECKKELCKVLESKNKFNTIVIPVIVRPCAWDDQESISDLKALPTDGKAITQWDNEDEAFLDIYKAIRSIVVRIPFRLKRQIKDALTQVEFISQHKENIKLDDLFVFPQIEVYQNAETEYPNRQICKFEDLWKRNKHIVLVGDDRIGKTIICQKLFLIEVEKGTPSVLISGSDVTSPINHERLINEKFQEQFDGCFSFWKNQKEKLLIIDDFSKLTRLQFITFAKKYFERIIIVMSEDDYLTYFNDEEILASFELLKLGSLGHTKQEELIKKWLNLSNTSDDKGEIPHGRIDQIEDRLNSIILHNRIVPRYQFYVLSILQTYEAFMPQSLHITAYGHCYQALITAQLVSAGIKKGDIDSALNFLSFFSFEIYKRQGECSKDQFEQFLKNYENQYIVKKSVVNRLINHDSPIIRTYRDKYKFNYPFIYFFLLGNFFAQNYESHRKRIEEIAEKSYLRDNAYILIFTVHHTQDNDLIDAILLYTEYAFERAPAATLSTSETKLLESALKELPEKILSSRSVEVERVIERDRRDETEGDLEDLAPDDSSEEDSLHERDLIDFNRILKNMEILGQILKNKYGSLPREKIEEVMWYLTDAGLRLIKVVTNGDNIQRLEGYFTQVVKNSKIPEDDKQRIEHFLRNQIRAMFFFLIGGLLNKVVVSIRKPELLQVVESLYQRKDTPAYDLLYIIFLLDTSEKLGPQDVEKITSILSKFEKSKNEVARRLLSLRLQYFLNTHSVGHKLRGRLFDALKFKYHPNPLKRL